jgi:hypothetical protein
MTIAAGTVTAWVLWRNEFMKEVMRWSLGLTVGAWMWSSLAMTGCAVASDDSDAEGSLGANELTQEVGDSVASTSQALIGGWASGPYSWSQAVYPARKLAPVATHVCVLTRFTGKFAGMGESVQLTDDGTNWYLQGTSQQTGVGGEAHCFPRAEFRGIDSNTRVSSEYELYNASYKTCAPAAQKDMYAADAFVFLSGLKGELAGGGEYGLVQQGLDVDVPSYMEMRSCTRLGGLYAFARNFRVGTHTPRLAQLVARNGFVGDANSVPDYLIGGDVGSASAVMARTSEAMCAFTLIQGKFAGNGEMVQIRAEDVNGVERWVLRMTKGAGSDYVRVGARCFARDQR